MDFDRPQKQALAKADQSTFGSDVLVIIWVASALMIGEKNHSMPLCAYVAGFGKAGHI